MVSGTSCSATTVINISSQTNVSCKFGSNGAATISATGAGSPFTYSWSPSGGSAATASGLSAGTYTCTVTQACGTTFTQLVTITEPTAIALTLNSQTNIACFGGSNGAASVNAATGGAGGYTYNWTPGNPTGDGTVGVKTDMRLALSEIHNRAVEFGKKHKLDGPQLIDEVARTMLGKETRAEDAKLRAYGQHLKSLADTHKQTAKHMAAQGNYSVSEINKEIRTADQLNKKAKEYLAIDREKVVSPAHIARIEAVMKKYPETKVILDDIRDLLRSHVELAHATGLIDAHTARKWNSKKDYIPMYKPED